MYSIREVNPDDPEIAETIISLDALCFPNDSHVKIKKGDSWWLCYDISLEQIAAYAGLCRSSRYSDVGYLCRVGVIPSHRGKHLQRRLLSAREAKARRIGWIATVTDCTADNFSSANSLISSGYKLYAPAKPWAFKRSLYWRKFLRNPN